MPSTINADNGVISGITGVRTTADNSGNLALQANGVTVLTVNTANAAVFSGAVSVAGNATVSGNTTFTGSISAPNTFSFKNRLINGAMGIWQRGTTYALTTSYAYGSADRFGFIMGATAAGVANQVASGLSGFQYALKLGRNSGSSSTGGIEMAQAVETVNSLDLAGQIVTLSFWAKAGANLSNFSPYVAVVSGTGTDQGISSIQGGWTGYATSINSTASVTTTWTRFSFSGTIASNATQVGIRIGWAPSGTAGADDNLYITGLQLEVGAQATSFDYRSITTEAALCQRYFCKSFNLTTAPANGGGGTSVATYIGAYLGPIIRPNYTPFPGGATDSTTPGGGCVTAFISFPVTMRATPTITSYGNSSGQWHYIDGSNVSGYATCTSGGGNVAGTAGFQGSWSSIINVGSASAAAGHWTASAEL